MASIEFVPDKQDVIDVLRGMGGYEDESQLPAVADLMFLGFSQEIKDIT